MSNDSIVYVGLDVHKESIVAAYAVDFGEVQRAGNIGVRDCDLDKLCKRMQSKASEVAFVYEAGPCGFGLQRYLARKGFRCMVCGSVADRAQARGSGQDGSTRRREAGQGLAHERLVRGARAGRV